MPPSRWFRGFEGQKVIDKHNKYPTSPTRLALATERSVPSPSRVMAPPAPPLSALLRIRLSGLQSKERLSSSAANRKVHPDVTLCAGLDAPAGPTLGSE